MSVIGRARVTGGGYRDGRGTTRGTDGAEQEKTAGIATTATVIGGRRHTVDLLERSKDDREGDLLHRGPVHLSMRMPKRRPIMHWVLLLGPMQ